MININVYFTKNGNIRLNTENNNSNEYQIIDNYIKLFYVKENNNMLKLDDFLKKNNNLKKYLNFFNYLNDFNTIKIKYQINKYNNLKKKYKTIDITKYIFKDCNKNKQFYCYKPSKINNIKIVKLPKNTIIYKGIINTEYSKNPSNIFNLKGSNKGWFSTKNIASNYGNNKNENVYKYKTIRKLNLYLLNNNNNLKILFNEIQNKIKKIITMKKINFNKLNILLNEIIILRITTGIYTTYNKQLKLLKDYSKYTKYKVIEKEKKYIKNYNKTIFKINNNTYSNLYLDLNRISISTFLDSLLTDIINKYYNIDGYISYKVPSLWEFGEWKHDEKSVPFLHEEIALTVQRGSIKLQ